MLYISASPQLLWILMTMTFPEGKSTCFQCSVSTLLLTRRIEQVLDGSVLCVVGYTGIHSLEAMVVPKLLIEGSCKATKSIPLLASATLEMRACWQVCDLLTFCCQMEMVFLL